MSKEDDERFWNLAIYKIYATNDEMAQMAPFMVIASLVIVSIFGICALANKQKPVAESPKAEIILVSPDGTKNAN